VAGRRGAGDYGSSAKTLWTAAHARLKRTYDTYLRRAGGKLVGHPELSAKYLLSGFLQCGVCKGNLLVDLRSVKGKLRRAYVCANRKARGAEGLLEPLRGSPSTRSTQR
jgi:hypothetical protein